MSEWISVDDRLPEETGENLVYSPLYGGGCYISQYSTMLGGFRTRYSGYGNWVEYEHKDITHWMPLPTPPE